MGISGLGPVERLPTIFILSRLTISLNQFKELLYELLDFKSTKIDKYFEYTISRLQKSNIFPMVIIF